MKKLFPAIRKALGAKIKVSTLLALVLLVAFSVTAIAAAIPPSNVTAILSPDVTIKYNGVVQEMKDANGNVVYPILYKGTTYVPIRAVSNMLGLPVDWDGDTRTVLLGTSDKPGTSFLDVAKKGYNGNVVFTTNKEFPEPVDEFGNPTGAAYTAAIKWWNNGASSYETFTLSGSYQVLTFTAYSADDSFTLWSLDADTDIIRLEEKVEKNQQRTISVNISGNTKVKIGVKFDTNNLSADRYVYLLDPEVK